MIPGLLESIAELRGMSRESLESVIAGNFHDAFLG